MNPTYALPNMTGLGITSVPFDSAEDIYSLTPEHYVGHTPTVPAGASSRKEARRQIAENQVDNLARAIRRSRYQGVQFRIHVIGYENSDPADPRVLNPVVLHRLANCEGCTYASTADLNEVDASGDPVQARGIYVEAATASDLLSRFREVASFIGRIVK